MGFGGGFDTSLVKPALVKTDFLQTGDFEALTALDDFDEVGGGGEESLRRPEPEAGRRSARRQPEGSDGHQPERGAAERREAQPAGLREASE